MVKSVPAGFRKTHRAWIMSTWAKNRVSTRAPRDSIVMSLRFGGKNRRWRPQVAKTLSAQLYMHWALLYKRSTTGGALEEKFMDLKPHKGVGKDLAPKFHLVFTTRRCSWKNWKNIGVYFGQSCHFGLCKLKILESWQFQLRPTRPTTFEISIELVWCVVSA